MPRDPWREVSEALSQGFADAEARMDDLSRDSGATAALLERLDRIVELLEHIRPGR